jgi:glycosyltransferase involved in cell wall biosynthesis
VPEAVGFVPPSELGRWYERASVVCVPSRREGYGMVAREAMAYGRPVVVTGVGGLVDAVENERTGLIVPPRDVQALRSAITRLLDDSPLRERLGSAARAEARETFSREKEGALLADAYRDALR